MHSGCWLFMSFEVVIDILVMYDFSRNCEALTQIILL